MRLLERLRAVEEHQRVVRAARRAGMVSVHSDSPFDGWNTYRRPLRLKLRLAAYWLAWRLLDPICRLWDRY